MLTQPGKLRGLQRLADADGVFSMLAVDQRPPVEQLIAERRGASVAAHADMVDLKRVLLDELGPTASAVLLDPLTAFPSGERVGARQGLILTLEDAVVEHTDAGRRTKWIDDWSVDQIKRAGADAVKLLAWYRPDAGPAVLAHQQRLVAETGADCERFDIPFVLELLLYQFPGQLSGAQPFHGAQRAELVLESLEAFAGSEFAVDVFKIESPYLPEELPPIASDGGFHQSVFDDVHRVVGRPWVLLSGGADRSSFLRALEYAYAAGASGYLAGRSIWWDAATRFPDLDGIRRELRDDAVSFMREVNALTRERAAAWHLRGDDVTPRPDPGPDFCRSYNRMHACEAAVTR